MDVVAKALAPGDFVPREAKLAVVEAFGAEAVVAYRRDARECARRATAGMPALTRPDVLDLLMALPVGEPVPVDSLSERERRVLKSLPKAVVRRDGTITRKAMRPVRIDMVFVPGRSWEAAMEKAERFTPFSARTALADGVLRRKDDAVLRADFHGIGLFAVRGDAVDVVVPPRPANGDEVTDVLAAEPCDVEGERHQGVGAFDPVRLAHHCIERRS
ncbi:MULTISPECIES: hypothetical protein [unclassified Streptomyces]|uniref:hypothetical protein n=1 Tax=unclassified Streptomyces TaxID=2593676 RepID=UPI001BEB5536|nr:MULTISPECIES: hypothetical protein [unclassified Streptomyces]MBT2407991.1 hypothetical protein [Streptomyces sp. ISL-21]MBT2613351.1 hypothetical protein [Streptomyces sp. ISL-87]